jgi:hypothetical protein
MEETPGGRRKGLRMTFNGIALNPKEIAFVKITQ